MGFLERSAIRRAEKQLRSAFDADEEVLDFDIGTTDRGQRVHCIATNKALYLVPRGGSALRIPYTTIRATQGGPAWLGLTTLAGGQYTIDFGRAPRGVPDVVVDHYRHHARQRRQFRVSWAGGGASFLVSPSDEGSKVIALTLNEGIGDDANASLCAEQAQGELEISLGLEPSLRYENPRPEWMGEFRWDPPLDEH